ncbi:MAG: SGNH/GDSL hydrolase family protein [Kiritimatiellia bacterium]|jgi:hypothetical protein|nr:SGNH/GDSL hydrolase family protein [Kiritimatiellia bacterium]MDP6849158.1 SGNH/GDSL hydrolase family protein [Kiritimatiellia bacterium]
MRLQTITLIAFVGIAGLASAVDNAEVQGTPVKQTRNLTEFDPILGWRRIPDFHGTHVQGEYQVEQRYNSRSMRGPLIPYEKATGTYRILILGDSFADGYSVAYDDLFSETLKRRWKETIKKPLEVVNAAVGGYGTDQQLLYFLIEGKRYKPDLTILLFYQNDVPFNTRALYTPLGRGNKPLFGLHDGKLYLDSLPEPSKSIQHVERKDFYKEELVKRTLEMFAKPKTITDESAKRRFDAWKMTEALMKKVKESCENNGSHFLLFFVPVKGDVYGGGGRIQQRPCGTSSNLKQLALRQEIDIIDTLPLCRIRAEEILKEKKRLYWVRDSHWTPEGHHLAGEIIAQYLIERTEHYRIPE